MSKIRYASIQERVKSRLFTHRGMYKVAKNRVKSWQKRERGGQKYKYQYNININISITMDGFSLYLFFFLSLKLFSYFLLSTWNSLVLNQNFQSGGDITLKYTIISTLCPKELILSNISRTSSKKVSLHFDIFIFTIHQLLKILKPWRHYFSIHLRTFWLYIRHSIKI